MTVIIGIDPGSRITGYGVIAWKNNCAHHIDHGCIRIKSETLHVRLKCIFEGIDAIVKLHAPTEAAIEQIFMHHNPSSALKLGQARGAAIVGLGLPISEYSARQVKQSIVGYGAADKHQIQHMIKILLNIKGKIQPDAADALAIALCHAHARLNPKTLDTFHTRRKRSSSWRMFCPE